MCMPDLRDEWQKHAENNNEDICLGQCCLSEWCVEVAVRNCFFLGVGCFAHGVHGHVPDRLVNAEKKMGTGKTYKKVPPEKHNTHPVDQVKPSSPPRLARPNAWMIAQVAKAPAGAARLKKARCVRAVRFERPCLRRTEVRPNAAGALCSMMARKTMNDNEFDGAAEEAPNAIPSAQA